IAFFGLLKGERRAVFLLEILRTLYAYLETEILLHILLSTFSSSFRIQQKWLVYFFHKQLRLMGNLLRSDVMKIMSCFHINNVSILVIFCKAMLYVSPYFRVKTCVFSVRGKK